MRLTQTRRRFLTGLSLAAAAGALRPLKARAAQGALETTSVRFVKVPPICIAPQYVAAELLRDEGFTDVRYVEAGGPFEVPRAIAEGRADFCSDLTLDLIFGIDASASITVVSGVHAGCYELFAHGNIRAIADLKGKSVGSLGANPLISMFTAWIGLDPKKDLTLVSDPAAKPFELFLQRKLDAYLAFPPEPQELHARKVGHVILRTAVDQPWSDYFCCMLAGNRAFVRNNPVATKRVIRALLKAADLCASAPERAARLLVSGGFAKRYDYALQTFNENPYGSWRDYDAEDTVRFYALRAYELNMIRRGPKQIIEEGTDFRFFNELKRELKA